MSVLITNIQRYAIHNGGGIRTTVFFKGCPLACSWCHNPETQSFKAEGEVFNYTPRQLAKLVMRDQIFFGEQGGVTLSGGEPLAQDMGYMTEFLRILKQSGAHIACDTCGDVPWDNFAAVLPYVDLFLYDIKAATEELHVEYTGRSNVRIIDNLGKLAQHTAQVWLRIPVIGGYNDGEEMTAIIDLAKKAAPGRKISLLPYHTMGKDKWDKIDKSPRHVDFYTPGTEAMAKIAMDWKRAGFEAEIGG
ncbi:MAG: radical SAM protein [Defluviitaleaceae bacterium]|nr:radical SAM protein [Defluviitaleaceae bacterium]